eukprot:TRINITY_DN67912_c0_g9_i1.p2 TRINITY_DN67912_c0_g9~~TRINITY_DN67912_c0_g9_i1.p2  ORF type:complete len:427 (+),score=53.10 TRINITY_DN67912_c0_g9_i1:93-1373(+)
MTEPVTNEADDTPVNTAAIEETIDKMMRDFNAMINEQRKLCTLEEGRIEELQLEMEKRRRRWHKREKDHGGESPLPRRIVEKRRERAAISSMVKRSTTSEDTPLSSPTFSASTTQPPTPSSADQDLLSPTAIAGIQDTQTFTTSADDSLPDTEQLLQGLSEDELRSVEGIDKTIDEIKTAVEKLMQHMSTKLAVEQQNKILETASMEREMVQARNHYIEELRKLQKIYSQQSRTCRESAEFPLLLKNSYGKAIQNNITRWETADNLKAGGAPTNSAQAEDSLPPQDANEGDAVSETASSANTETTTQSQLTSPTNSTASSHTSKFPTPSEKEKEDSSNSGGTGKDKDSKDNGGTTPTSGSATVERKSRIVIPEGSKPVPTPRTNKSGTITKATPRATPRNTTTPRTTGKLVSGVAPSSARKPPGKP